MAASRPRAVLGLLARVAPLGRGCARMPAVRACCWWPRWLRWCCQLPLADSYDTFEPVVRVHGERRFLGALDLSSSKPVSRAAVVIRAGEVFRDQFKAVLATDAERRDLVLRAYLVRLAIG